MKNIISSLLVLFILFSCSSDEIMPQDKLIGNWKWIVSSGGIAGITITPKTEGYEEIIEFTSKTMKIFRDGNLLSERNYTVIFDISRLSNEKAEIIVYEDDWRQTFRIEGDFLYLIDECHDCFASQYSRE